MELTAHFEHSLSVVVTLIKLCLEGISVFCIVVGLLNTGQAVLRTRWYRNRQNSLTPFIQVRLRFGLWLALALEFQLGADILATTVQPTFESLGKLGLIAFIRTLLNYFLSRELDAELQYQERLTSHADRKVGEDNQSEG